MDETGELIHPDTFKTPEQGATASVPLAASPLIEGVTGCYFDKDVQPAEVVPGGAA
ncbi:hypothetical protein ACQP2E_23810 [Actinoplanes sp. CA-015351]|uniref:hypothetical protein n=1 Tax=Actinoplanes sp. CA-015351 TaxID=3239897 RepID=UPI003D98F745